VLRRVLSDAPGSLTLTHGSDVEQNSDANGAALGNDVAQNEGRGARRRHATHCSSERVVAEADILSSSPPPFNPQTADTTQRPTTSTIIKSPLFKVPLLQKHTAQSTTADHFLVEQLRLAPGEVVEVEASRVSVRLGGLARKKGTAHESDLATFQLSTGNLYLTNYALVFIPFFSRSRSKVVTPPPLQHEERERVDTAAGRSALGVYALPLTSIFKANKHTAKVGNKLNKLQRTTAHDKQLVVVQMKDGRTLRIGFNRASIPRRALLSRLRELLPTCAEHTFAYAWHRALVTAVDAAAAGGAAVAASSPSARGTLLGRWSSAQLTRITRPRSFDEWRHFDPTREYLRQGVSGDGESGVDDQAVNGSLVVPSSASSPTGAGGWRVSSANENFEVCDTYPRQFVVPTLVDDEQVMRIKDFRSRGRLPVLAWRHPSNGGSLTRCGQPRVGLSRARCIEDEQLFAAMLQTNGGGTSAAKKRLYLMDARPRLNAIANSAKGAGVENAAAYKGLKIRFLGIDNIHVMRNSLFKVYEACQFREEANLSRSTSFLSALDSSHWLDYSSLILRSAVEIARLVHVKGATVLIHCSDGWDRTPQLSSLACLMMDGYYRTLDGFIVLIEKEWISFGHKFAERCRHYDGGNDSEYSPVFLQFLDCVSQMLKQAPTAFEFNNSFLVDTMDAVHSARYGTFLCNTEKERYEGALHEHTISWWDEVKHSAHKYVNHLYEASDDVIYPSWSMRHLYFWREYFCRWEPLHFQPNRELQWMRLVTPLLGLPKQMQELRQENETLRRELAKLRAASAASAATTRRDEKLLLE